MGLIFCFHYKNIITSKQGKYKFEKDSSHTLVVKQKVL